MCLQAADSGGQLKLTLKGSLLGLSELLQRLFGVTLRHEDLAPGEMDGLLVSMQVRQTDCGHDPAGLMQI